MKQIRQYKSYFKQYKKLADNDKTDFITFEEIVNTADASFIIIESVKKHKWIDIKS